MASTPTDPAVDEPSAMDATPTEPAAMPTDGGETAPEVVSGMEVTGLDEDEQQREYDVIEIDEVRPPSTRYHRTSHRSNIPLFHSHLDPETTTSTSPQMLFVSFVNSLRNRNPGAMEVVVPGVDAAGDAVPIRPSAGKDGIQELLKKNDLTSIVPLKNREPKWNPQSNMYQLDFNGRATLASCKNIQLHPKNGADSDVVFLMGKVEENKFNVDFKAPLSCMQAFAFALIVFDNSSGAF